MIQQSSFIFACCPFFNKMPFLTRQLVFNPGIQWTVSWYKREPPPQFCSRDVTPGWCLQWLQASPPWIRVVKWKDVPPQKWAIHTPSQRLKTDWRFSRNLAWDDETPLTKGAMKRKKVVYLQEGLPLPSCCWSHPAGAAESKRWQAIFCLTTALDAFPLLLCRLFLYLVILSYQGAMRRPLEALEKEEVVY